MSVPVYVREYVFDGDNDVPLRRRCVAHEDTTVETHDIIQYVSEDVAQREQLPVVPETHPLRDEIGDNERVVDTTRTPTEARRERDTFPRGSLNTTITTTSHTLSDDESTSPSNL